MIALFDALTGIGSLPSTVNVEGRDLSIITDYRTWCRLDSYLFDTRFTDEMRGQFMMGIFFPALTKREFEIVDGAFPFSAEAGRDALMEFWLAGREVSGGSGSKGGERIVERPFDYLYDAAMIYAAFQQAYKIDLAAAGDMHWWTFYALFSNLPDGTQFAAAKAARVSKPEKYPEHMRAAQHEIKEAYQLPAHIRYFGDSKTGKMTDAEFLEHVRKRREELQARNP